MSQKSEIDVCGWNREVGGDRFGLMAGRRALIGMIGEADTDSPRMTREDED